jgi:predicted dehydrogenase
MDYGEVMYDKDDLCLYAKECDVHDNTIITVRYDNEAKLSYLECHFTPDYSREFTMIGTKGRIYGFYNNRQDFRIEVTYRDSDKKDIRYPPKMPGGHGGGDPLIQKEFLDIIEKGIVSCPGVVGARNSAAIAIAAAEAVHTGKPVTIPPCPKVHEAIAL